MPLTLQPSYQDGMWTTSDLLMWNARTYDNILYIRRRGRKSAIDVFSQFPLQSPDRIYIRSGVNKEKLYNPAHRIATPSRRFILPSANPIHKKRMFRIVEMLAKLLFFALSLPLVAVCAENGYLGMAGRGLLAGRDSGCLTDGPQSCHNTTAQTDLCCFEAPGVSAFLSFRFQCWGY